MNNNGMTRRDLLKMFGAAGAIGAFGTLSLTACSSGGDAARVVVVGGGFGGATAAKYLKFFNPGLDVTLVEPATEFYTFPFSNLYLGGLRQMKAIRHGYDTLRDRYGVNVVHAYADDVDGDKKTVRLSTGDEISYDKLVLSPGIDIRWNALEGYDEAAAQFAPHAWKAGDQTRLLRQQLEAMEDGGTFILSAPANPFRCPPGPYERVSLIAHYFTQHKPRSKILILDAKDNFSKQGLFTNGWAELYGDMIEWVGLSNDGRVVRVDAENRTVETEFGTIHEASVLNVVPPQKAGFIADRAGVTNESGWAPVKPHTFESQQVDDIYVIGDASIAAPMPKSGFCANNQAKVVAAAIVAELDGREPVDPKWANTCYSVLSPEYGISVANVYGVVDGKIADLGGGLSPSEASADFRLREARYAVNWYNAISQDAWGTADLPE